MATELKLTVKLPADFKQAANMFPKAGSAVLNRTAQGAVTLLAREIPKQWNIRSSDVRSKITLRRASVNNLRAVIEINSKNFSLSRFMKNKAATTRRQPVVVEVKKGKRTTLTNRTFVNTVRGNLAVLQRSGEERLPFKYRQSVSAWLIFSSKEMKEKLSKFVDETIRKELPRVIEVFRKTGRE